MGQRCRRAAGADEAALDRCRDLGIRRWRSRARQGSEPEPGPFSAGPGPSRERLPRSGQKESGAAMCQVEIFKRVGEGVPYTMAGMKNLGMEVFHGICSQPML